MRCSRAAIAVNSAGFVACAALLGALSGPAPAQSPMLQAVQTHAPTTGAMMVGGPQAAAGMPRMVESGSVGAAGPWGPFGGDCPPDGAASFYQDINHTTAEWNPNSWLTFSAGAIWLDRERTGTAVLITQDENPFSPAILSASDYSFSTEAGLDLSFIFHTDIGQFELRYWGIDTWSSFVGPFNAPAGSAIQFGTPYVSFVDALAISSLKSELFNGELNWRCDVADRWYLIAGLRYMELDEAWRLNEDQGFGFGFDDIASDVRAINYMYGVQVGANVVLLDFRRRVWLEGWFKTAVFRDLVKTRGSVTQFAEFTDTAFSGKHHTAFVGELGINLVGRITQNIGIKAGYQAMWLEGVALAEDQVRLLDPFLGTGTATFGGSLLYHGGSLQLDVTW